jgi:exopolysaccharide biosynthesis polyprenyl glycosylphosphotransferase
MSHKNEAHPAFACYLGYVLTRGWGVVNSLPSFSRGLGQCTSRFFLAFIGASPGPSRRHRTCLVEPHTPAMIEHLRTLSPRATQKLNLAMDVVILAGASFAAAVEHGELHWKIALVMTATATVLWAGASRALRHYDIENGRGFAGDLALTLVLVTAVVVPMTLLRLLIPRYAVTTEITRFFAVLVPAILWVRLRATGLRLWRARPIDRVLIVGVGALGRLTHREIRDTGQRRTVIGYLRFDDEQSHARLHAPVLGTTNDIEATLRDHVVNEVYFATTAGHQRADVQSAIRVCEKFGIPFALPACGYRFARAKPACADAIPDGYVHYLSVQNKPIQTGLKRVIDIVASSVALLVLSPILVGTAIAVRFTSRGPVLFRQERVGQFGRTFHMLKFRSMVQNAEELKAKLMAHNEQTGPVFKMQRDPRITSIGRFIRKYSIDELPQLLNVLRGDMSIVGPRPPLQSEVLRYQAWQRRRLSVRPGLTCVWQVSGRNQISFEEWMLLDMRYIDHWSLAQDLQLILKTVPIVLSGRGAS